MTKMSTNLSFPPSPTLHAERDFVFEEMILYHMQKEIVPLSEMLPAERD
jgi:hypothetical protein